MKERYSDYAIDLNDEENKKVDLTKSIADLNSTLYHFEMELNGYRWSGTKKKYIYTGEVLVSSEMSGILVSIMSTFTEQSNLITGKESLTFERQKFRTLSLINDELTKNTLDVPIEHKRAVLNKCMNTLQNIGDIILSSKDTIHKFSGSRDDEYMPRAKGDLI